MIDKALTIDGWMTETELAFLYSMASSVSDAAKLKFAVTLATRILFDHVCVWDSIWFVKKRPTMLKRNRIPAAEVKARRVLLKQSF